MEGANVITNLTKKIVISSNERWCTHSFSWGWGLMFARKQNAVMVFAKPRRISLHMWFVFFPIDVLIVDKHQKIVEIKRNFRPCTFWKSQKKATYVVELGVPSQYEVGDKLTLARNK